MCITKLDVLEGLSQLNICTAYKTKDEAEVSYPLEVSELEKIEPEYESFPGWRKGTKGVRSFDSLPPQARDYLNFISDAVGVDISIISTGAERDDTIILRDPFCRND